MVRVEGCFLAVAVAGAEENGISRSVQCVRFTGIFPGFDPILILFEWYWEVVCESGMDLILIPLSSLILIVVAGMHMHADPRTAAGTASAVRWSSDQPLMRPASHLHCTSTPACPACLLRSLRQPATRALSLPRPKGLHSSAAASSELASTAGLAVGPAAGLAAPAAGMTRGRGR